MDNRKLINYNIVRWIENRVQTKYPKDVSMVLLYGSYINGTANNMSDVDCYFIPRTERGYEMAIDFIIGGTGYDIFPMSWDRIERISDLKDVLLPCVGDVQILYYHSEEDLKKFKQLQRKLQRNLKNSLYIKSVVQEKFWNACDMYSKIKNCTNTITIRKLAGNIIMTLADMIALHNHDYFHFGLKKQFEDLQNNLPNIPEGFIKGYINVIESIDNSAYIEHCFELLKITADYLDLELQINSSVLQEPTYEKVQTDYDWLAGLYEEISSTFNKIYICCKSNNYILAFLSAVCLQCDLDKAVEFGGMNYDLLSSYNHTELSKLLTKAKDIEQDYVQKVLSGGGIIKKYDNFEEFIRANL